MSTNVTVKGIKVKNSPQFNFRFDGCNGIHIDSLNIKAPSSSPNTDGIHIENTNDVRIYNSLIANGKCILHEIIIKLYIKILVNGRFVLWLCNM